jgi:hypothetical protein
LLVTATGTWLLMPSAEAGHMMPRTANLSLPSSEEAVAIDRAVQRLNTPWTAIFISLESSFDKPDEAILTGVEADMQRGILRLNGKARDVTTALALPSLLRQYEGVADAVLLGQEIAPGNSILPVRITLELRIKEAP